MTREVTLDDTALSKESIRRISSRYKNRFYELELQFQVLLMKAAREQEERKERGEKVELIRSRREKRGILIAVLHSTTSREKGNFFRIIFYYPLLLTRLARRLLEDEIEKLNANKRSEADKIRVSVKFADHRHPLEISIENVSKEDVEKVEELINSLLRVMY